MSGIARFLGPFIATTIEHFMCVKMSILDEEKTWVSRDFGLDGRLIKGLSKLGYTFPTLVQAKCIPLALRGKDVLVRARTGSGKTVAFALPVIHKILTAKTAASALGQSAPSSSSSSRGKGSSASLASVQAIILVPTNELSKQIENNLADLLYYCRDSVAVCNVGDDSVSALQVKLRRHPDIIVATPAKLAKAVKSKLVDLSGVQTLVIDEADLVLSFGYSDYVQEVTAAMPKIFQGLLMVPLYLFLLRCTPPPPLYSTIFLSTTTTTTNTLSSECHAVPRVGQVQEGAAALARGAQARRG